MLDKPDGWDIMYLSFGGLALPAGGSGLDVPFGVRFWEQGNVSVMWLHAVQGVWKADREQGVLRLRQAGG